MQYKIASWNVNGIRAASKKGFWDWFSDEKCHVVCLQETKAWPEQLEPEVVEPKYYLSDFACAEKKGYSGVATYSKKSLPLVKSTVGLGEEQFDREGRTIVSEFESFFLINGYFPNGQRDHSRVDYKLDYSQFVADLAKKLNKKKPVLILGDFNTAHREIDLANPKTNQKTTGFLPREREWMDQFMDMGFTDLFRFKNGDELGAYTWWTYRGDCRERNIGWRIDYFFGTEDLLPHVKKVFHQPNVMGSDHCPLIVQLKF